MAAKMTHWERVRATLQGRETDRIPISMWRHFFDRETTTEGLARAMLAFQERFDWDFMKVNPRASYHVEGWGLKTAYNGSEHPKVVDVPIKHPNDWLKLEILPLDRGVFKEHLNALEIIARGLKGQVPFVMTVFTPLGIAGRMTATEDIFVQHLREYPDKVKYALEVITGTFASFAKACIDRGASGLFFATTGFATSDRITLQEYETIARPYDLRVLEALPETEFNILHICRENNFLRALIDYPVQAFNWDALGCGNLSLPQGKAIAGSKVVIGGIPHRRQDIAEASPEQLADQISSLQVTMGKTGWMLGTGCTFPPETPEKNIESIICAAAS